MVIYMIFYSFLKKTQMMMLWYTIFNGTSENTNLFHLIQKIKMYIVSSCFKSHIQYLSLVLCVYDSYSS